MDTSNFTTPEQSERLMKLGLNPNTADMWWSRCAIIDDDDKWVGFSVAPVNLSWAKHTEKDIPCWSAGALLNIVKSADSLSYELYCNGLDDFQINIHLYKYSRQHGKSLTEAVYLMVVWLLENKIIRKHK